MKRYFIGLVAVVVAALASRTSIAETAFQKYRVSLIVNSQSTADGLRTNADNTSLFRNPFGGITAIDDPRPDSGTRNEAKIKDDLRFDAQVSYGVLKWKWAELTLDASIGYFKGDLGDLETAGQFTVVDPPRVQCGENTRYHMLYIPIGEIEEQPVKVGGTMRFRPRATGGGLRGMSPFFSVGVGYMFVDLTPTEEFLDFSLNVAKSSGYYQKVDPARPGQALSGRIHQFKAAAVETPDTFEYHATAGIEFPIKKGLFAVISAGWMWADKEIDITVDGKHNFGSATPQGFSDIKYPVTGLAVVVTRGGFVDYASGRPRPKENQPCKFTVGHKDGVVDTGSFYVQGGKLAYSGSSVGFGFRYQF